MSYREMNLSQLKQELGVLTERSSSLESSINVLSAQLGIEPDLDVIDVKIKQLELQAETNKKLMDSILDELESVTEGLNKAEDKSKNDAVKQGQEASEPNRLKAGFGEPFNFTNGVQGAGPHVNQRMDEFDDTFEQS